MSFDSGIVEFSEDFVVIQPVKRKKPWLAIFFAIVIICSTALAYYYNSSRPIIQVIPESKELFSERVVSGIPTFMDNGLILFIRRSGNDRNEVVFKKISLFGEEIAAKAQEGTEYLQAAFSYRDEDKQVLALVLNKHSTPRVAAVSVDKDPAIISYGEYPNFSPDGNKIVFNKKGDIWIMNVDGSSQRPSGLKGHHPEWSPVKDEIVFESDKNKKSVIQVVSTSEKSKPEALTSQKDSCMYPSFSPDGKVILYFKKGDGLWAMKQDGSRKVRVLRSTSETVMGRISLDGKQLVVWSGNRNEGKLWVYDIKYKRIRPPERRINVQKLAILAGSIKEKASTESDDDKIITSEAVDRSYGYLDLSDVKPESGVNVYIDEQKVAATPVSEPILVEEGNRAIKLENTLTGTIWEKYHDFRIDEEYTPKDVDLR